MKPLNARQVLGLLAAVLAVLAGAGVVVPLWVAVFVVAVAVIL